MAGASSGSLMHFGNELQINDAGYLSTQQHQLRSLAVESPLHRAAGASRATRPRTGAGGSAPTHNDHGAAAQPSVPHQPREPAAQRQLRVRADQRQQRRRRRPAHARQRRGEAAAQLQQLLRVPAAARRQLGVQHRGGGVQRRACRATTRSATASRSSRPTSSAMRSTCTSAWKWSRTPDWLVWQQDNLIGSFDGRQTNLNAGFNWIMTNRQELRLKLQAIGLNADLRQALSRRPRRQCDSHRRAGRRLQRPQSRAADPLPLRARARSHICMWCTAAAASTRRRPPTTRTACSATASACATTSSC